jgi:hypothetical protein
MDDLSYFSGRAQHERRAALHTSEPKARDLHLQLAEAYEAKLRELMANSDGVGAA